ncbi:MAG: radical SAM protein [Candidatus Aminicenantes bacterium]|nr:MAG: radical SAM protein [Candidatus Aminicenantes bacterium]
MRKEKILLLLLPFWDPQIPPLGISCLKSYLQRHGYHVKSMDTNVVEEFNDIHNRYFDTLSRYVPENKRGNFNNVGHDVLRNHMMAFIHHEPGDEEKYLELVKMIIYKTFFTHVTREQIQELQEILTDFYHCLGEYLLKLLAREMPLILGLSVFRGNLAASMFAFKLTKEKYPAIKTVMGGAIFAGELAMGSENLEFFLKKTPYIDKIIVGEGEMLFLEYLRGELPESQKVYTLVDINQESLDISSAPAPDFSDFDLRFYPNLAAFTSRSCPFQCSFCTETIYWGKYREKKVNQIVKEMTELYAKYNSQLFLMCDSLLNLVITGLARDLVKSGLSLYWDGYLRADNLACSADYTWLWRRGGFYRARLGIESGSTHVLELMGKKISLEQIKTTISNLARAGIKTTTYWVVGHPGETEEDFRQTLEIIEELRDDIYEAWCSPFNYYKIGQVNSSQWEEKSQLLYPLWAKEMLVVQTWTPEVEPGREEAYQRMNRFVARCRQLGIPNPYSMKEFYQADERWKRLHKNAVPALVEFQNKDKYIDENKKIKQVVTAGKKLTGDIEFAF